MADAVQSLGIDPKNLKRDIVRPQKYHLLTNPQPPINVTDIKAVVKLEWSDTQTKFDSVSQSKTFEILMNSIFSPFFIAINDDLKMYQKYMLGLAINCKGFLYSRNKTGNQPKNLSATVLVQNIKKQTIH